MILLKLLIGGFYMLGGFLVIRSVVMETMLDQAIEAIETISTEDHSSSTDKLEHPKRLFLIAMALTMFLGGALLVFESWLAPIVFSFSFATQILYYVFIKPTDENTLSAKIPVSVLLYGVVTAALVWLYSTGQYIFLQNYMASISHREFIPLAMTAGIGAYGWYMLSKTNLRPASKKLSKLEDIDIDDGIDDADFYPGMDLHDVKEMRVMAEAFFAGVWVKNETQWEMAELPHLGVSKNLIERIYEWQDCYDSYLDEDDFSEEPNWTTKQKNAHYSRPKELALLLKQELSELDDTEISFSYYDADGTDKIV